MILAAPDGTGKTIVAENVAEYWAAEGTACRLCPLRAFQDHYASPARSGVAHGHSAATTEAGELTTKDLADLEGGAALSSPPAKITYLHTPGKSIELAGPARTLEAARGVGSVTLQ